jgi:hypothetical protein
VNVRVKLAMVLAVLAALVVTVSAAVAGGGGKALQARLSGFEEVPVVSTGARGEFDARLRVSSREISYELSYADLEGDVLQAHIHLGQRGVNGEVSAFLCSNLGNAPAGTPACPPSPATVKGTIGPAQVVGPTVQGIAPGEFDELARAILAGVTYANVHSSKFPDGEIRGQIEAGAAR